MLSSSLPSSSSSLTWSKVRNRRCRRALYYDVVFAELLRAVPDYGCNIFPLLHAVTVTVTPMELSAIKEVPSEV